MCIIPLTLWLSPFDGVQSTSNAPAWREAASHILGHVPPTMQMLHWPLLREALQTSNLPQRIHT